MIESGSVIARRYRLDKPLGQGQMSSVFLAVDLRRPAEPVVVKLLNSSHTDAIRQELFRRETQALQQLDHPNIIRIVDFGRSEEADCNYIVLPCYPRTLLDEIDRHPDRMDFRWYWPIMQALAEALEYAHAQGVVHRDIKPSNVLLDLRSAPVLTDFGISLLKYQLASGLTVSSFWSVGYAAPERRKGEPGDERSDIYSLGALLFHLLMRQAPPDDGPSQQALEGLGAPPIVSLLTSMLAQRPEDRPNIGRVSRRLQSLAGDLSDHPVVRINITSSAARDLYDLGHTDDSFPAAAVQFLERELGSGSSDALLERDGSISIMTQQFKLVCEPRRDDGILELRGVREFHGPNLESQRAESTMVWVSWQVVSIPRGSQGRLSASSPPAPGLSRLIETLEEHNQERAQSHADRIQRRDFVGSWERVLRYQELESREASARLAYVRQRQQDGLITFELAEPPPDALGWREGMAIALLGTGERKPEPLGTLYSLAGNVLTVAADPSAPESQTGSGAAVPPSGNLVLDRAEQLAAVRRQRSALVEVRAGATENRRLGDVLADVRRAEFDEPNSDLHFIQENLEEDQREAVRRALTTRDLFVLQGPPGTGKTTVIAEIILQILTDRPGARILVSSQSNTAVNHAVTRVAALHAGNRLEIVRLGREDKIAQGAEDWTLRRRREDWRRQVVQRCEDVLSELALQARQSRSPTPRLQDAETANLRQYQSWIEEAEKLLDECEQDQERLAALGDALTDQLQSGAVEGDDTSLAIDTEALREQIEQRKFAIGGHLATIRSFIGDQTPEAHQENLRAEASRLRAQISTALEGGSRDDPTRSLRGLVREWRDIFGLTEAFSAPLLQRANIIAATCLFAGGWLLREQRFDWAIVDEAGRATAPELLVPLVRARRAILVGDERQLPPLLDDEISEERLREAGIDAEGLGQSLFETLVDDALSHRPEAVHRLTVQHRMHPAIGSMVSEVFYDGALKNGVSADQRAHGLDWMPRPVLWYSTANLPNHQEIRKGTSFANQVEVDSIERLLERMNTSFAHLGERREVGIIAGYAGQIELLDARLRPEDGTRWTALDLEIATVDGFQGRDRDIVIYSAVRSNRNRAIGFL